MSNGLTCVANLRGYIDRHYLTACNLQRTIKLDQPMLDMLRMGPADRNLVKAWMESYELFQGVTDSERYAIADRFLSFAKQPTKTSGKLKAAEIADLHEKLFVALYREVPRSWMSATSKLLWCLYPKVIVIYDTFVHRVLVVMQCFDKDLAKFPRIGTPPKIADESDIAKGTKHYMNYQAMVRELLHVHGKRLGALRKLHNESYPYDVRILDKLLWMIGDSKKAY